MDLRYEKEMKTEVQPQHGWATPRAQVSEGGAAVGTEPRWALIHSGRVSQTHQGGVGLGEGERGGVRRTGTPGRNFPGIPGSSWALGQRHLVWFSPCFRTRP